MSSTIGPAASGPRPEPVSVTYRRLQRMGFRDVEAANLTALKNGFEIPAQPWTARELAHLLFLREMSRAGDRSSDGNGSVVDDEVRARALVDPAPASTPGGGSFPPASRSGRRDGADPPDGAVTLLTLLRAMTGRDATLDLLRPAAAPRIDVARPGDGDGKAG